MPPYAEEQGGAVVSATISKFSYATLSKKNGASARIESVDRNEMVDCTGDHDLAFDGTLDLAKAVLRKLGPDAITRGRFSLLLHTDAPPGSGLGSSSAAVVAMLGVFREWYGLGWTRDDLARIACEIERKDLGIPGGYQDQYASTFGGFNFIEFNSETRVHSLTIDPDVVRELNYDLILCFTGSVEHHSGIIQDQVSRLSAGETDIREALDETKALAYRARDCLLEGNLADLGRILDEAWQEKKRFSKGITNRTLDSLYRGARAAGALGGKVTGAGGGGHMMLLCNPRRRRDVVKYLASIGVPIVDYAFVDNGLIAWKVR